MKVGLVTSLRVLNKTYAAANLIKICINILRQIIHVGRMRLGLQLKFSCIIQHAIKAEREESYFFLSFICNKSPSDYAYYVAYILISG